MGQGGERSDQADPGAEQTGHPGGRPRPGPGAAVPGPPQPDEVENGRGEEGDERDRREQIDPASDGVGVDARRLGWSVVPVGALAHGRRRAGSGRVRHTTRIPAASSTTADTIQTVS